MSLFKDALKIFESIKCEECGGLGKLQKQCPGPYNTGMVNYESVCKPCHGTGFKDGKPLRIRDD